MKPRFLALFCLFLAPLTIGQGVFASNKLPVVEVYRSPTCGCCGKWVEHMQVNGFEVKMHNVDDVSVYKKKFGVPSDKTSCHTAKVGKYFVEGHVPAKDVKKLLSSKSTAKGLTVPDMPVGSPGMEQGNTKDPYDVLAIDDQGKAKVFSSYNK